mmetsp:Transcript_32612/g.80387  ORF Transcript_32612/g.80387 Transcript_32612/m.80387 type:complete len:232 (+) Transcript_32612:41-736(+)
MHAINNRPAPGARTHTRDSYFWHLDWTQNGLRSGLRMFSRWSHQNNLIRTVSSERSKSERSLIRTVSERGVHGHRRHVQLTRLVEPQVLHHHLRLQPPQRHRRVKRPPRHRVSDPQLRLLGCFLRGPLCHRLLVPRAHLRLHAQRLRHRQPPLLVLGYFLPGLRTIFGRLFFLLRPRRVLRHVPLLLLGVLGVHGGLALPLQHPRLLRSALALHRLQTPPLLHPLPGLDGA